MSAFSSMAMSTMSMAEWRMNWFRCAVSSDCFGAFDCVNSAS